MPRNFSWTLTRCYDIGGYGRCRRRLPRPFVCEAFLTRRAMPCHYPFDSGCKREGCATCERATRRGRGITSEQCEPLIMKTSSRNAAFWMKTYERRGKKPRQASMRGGFQMKFLTRLANYLMTRSGISRKCWHTCTRTAASSPVQQDIRLQVLTRLVNPQPTGRTCMNGSCKTGRGVKARGHPSTEQCSNVPGLVGMVQARTSRTSCAGYRQAVPLLKVSHGMACDP